MSVLMLEDWRGRTFEVQTVRDDILRVASGEDLVGAVIRFDSGPAGTVDAADGLPLHTDMPRWVACRRKMAATRPRRARNGSGSRNG